MNRKRGRRHSITVFGAVLSAVAVLAVALGMSCAQPQREVHVALFKSPAVDAAQALVPEFERETGIKVILDILPYSELLDKVQTTFLAKSSLYDVVMADCIWIPKFAAAGYLQPIDAYLADSHLTPEDYNAPDLIPSVADYLGKYPAGGTTYGLPFMTNSHVLAYRRDLYERYLKPTGLRAPGKTIGEAWTWDEYFKAAKILTMPDPTAPDGKLWGSSMQAKAGPWIVYEWYSWLYGAGGRDIDYSTMKPQFTSPGSVEAIRRYASMVGTVAPPAVVSWGHEEETQALASGSCAMDATWNVELTGYLLDPARSAHARDFDFAVSPVGVNGKPTPDMGGYGLLLSKFSKNWQDSYRFMAWVTSPAIHKRLVLNGGTPFRESEMSDPEILAKHPEFAVYGIALENSIYRARVPNWPAIEDVISKELTRAMTGEAAAGAAAAAMQEKVAALLVAR